MDNVNQPQGQGPQEHAPTQPYRFTPGWPGGAQGGQEYGAPPGGPQWQQSAPPPQGPQGPYGPHGPGGPYGPHGPGGPYGPQWQQGPGPQPPQPKKDWKHSKRLRWTAGITAAVLLGAGGALAGLALAGSGGSSANPARAVALNSAISGTSGCPTPVPGSQPGGKAAGGGSAGSSKSGRRDCLRLRLRQVRGMYGEIAYHTANGTETLAFERGTVVSSSGGALVIRAGNGTKWTWNVASSSIVRESGKPVPGSLLTSGANVFVGGQVVGSSKDARLIVIHKKRPGGSSGQNSSGSSSSSNSSSGSAT
jgi:hypothetical protein